MLAPATRSRSQTRAWAIARAQGKRGASHVRPVPVPSVVVGQPPSGGGYGQTEGCAGKNGGGHPGLPSPRALAGGVCRSAEKARSEPTKAGRVCLPDGSSWGGIAGSPLLGRDRSVVRVSAMARLVLGCASLDTSRPPTLAKGSEGACPLGLLGGSKSRLVGTGGGLGACPEQSLW